VLDGITEGLRDVDGPAVDEVGEIDADGTSDGANEAVNVNETRSDDPDPDVVTA